MFDPALGEFEAIDIGDAAGAIDDAVGFDGVLLAVRLEHGAELAAGALDPEHLDSGMHFDTDRFALGPDLLHGIGVERRQEPRQHLENSDLGAGPRVDMAEFERDDAAADEQHASRAMALA